MKKPYHLLQLFVLLLLIISCISCNKNSNATVSLDSISSYNVIGALTTTSAQSYSLINAYGDATLTGAGVCWSSTNQAPTINDQNKAASLDTVAFTSNITGLTANTTYYLRAYVTNGAGTAYGNTVTFKTNTATFATTATVSTFSGNGTAGFVNGAVTVTQFANPQGICTDAQGNFYIADSYNNVIRKLTPAGVSSTFAGNGTVGYIDGPAATAEFYAPKAVAADAQGNIYVADYGNNVIRKITPAGVVSTLAGKGFPGYADGTGSSAVFKSPSGLVSDSQGNIFVADMGNNVIREITPAGVVTTFAGSTVASQLDGTGTAATFNSPSAITIDALGNFYVADAGNYAVRKITPAGVVGTIVGNHFISSVLGSPSGICIDARSNIYTGDAAGRIIQINAAGILRPVAGVSGTTGYTNGVNTNALFNNPQALTTDSQGNVYIVDYYNNVIRKMTVTTTP